MLAALTTACGGAATATTASTTAAETTTTTVVTTTSTTEEVSEGVSVEDLPAECVDALVEYLRLIEPVVADVDFANATLADLEALSAELESAATGFTDDLEALQCPEVDIEQEQDMELMREIAEREAPGTVAYLDWAASLASLGEDSDLSVSGDCETDIDAIQAIVDRGGTIKDLTLEEIAVVSQLLGAISQECPPERWQEFLAKSDVAAFLETGE